MSRKKKNKIAPLRLNLGGGQTKLDGFLCVDFYAKSADVKCDLFKTPWPWKDNSVDEVMCSHFLEHVPAKLRPQFFNEVYRILKPSGKATFQTPHWASERAYGDPTHEWPPICRFTYLYLNKEWREQNKIDHYLGFACNFNWGAHFTMNQQMATRSSEYVQHAAETQINAVDDLVVMLTPIK